MNKIILMVGAPGSGKSTYARKIWKENPKFKYLSSDALRQELGSGENDQSVTPLVFSTLHRRLEHCLRRNETVIVDATNINKKDRKTYIELAQKYSVEIDAFVFEASKQLLVERNINRGNEGGRNVPEHVIEKMLTKYQPPSKEEGFSSIKFIK